MTLLGHCQVSVRPVLDVREQLPVDAYEVPAAMREALRLSRPSSVFPWTSTSRPDVDHTTPFLPAAAGGPPGQTRVDNLGPMTRFAHRVKTHGRGWRHRQPVPGVYLWRTPHGFWFRTDQHGSRPLGRDPVAGSSPRWRRSSRASCSRAEACLAVRPECGALSRGSSGTLSSASLAQPAASPRSPELPIGPLARTPRAASGRSGAGAPNWEESRASCASRPRRHPSATRRRSGTAYAHWSVPARMLVGPAHRGWSDSAARGARRPARRRATRGTPAALPSTASEAISQRCASCAPGPSSNPARSADRALGTGPPLTAPVRARARALTRSWTTPTYGRSLHWCGNPRFGASSRSPTTPGASGRV